MAPCAIANAMSVGRAFWLMSSCESTLDELAAKIVATAIPAAARRALTLFFKLGPFYCSPFTWENYQASSAARHTPEPRVRSSRDAVWPDNIFSIRARGLTFWL